MVPEPLRRIIRATLARLRTGTFAVRRCWHVLSNPGVWMLGNGQQLAAGVQLRATGDGIIQLGEGAVLGIGVAIVCQRGCIGVGAHTFIGPWSTLVAKTGIMIGANCLIAERVTIRDQNHAIHGRLETPIAQAGFETAPIAIGDDVWIAAGAVILKGVTIGRGAVVAANAVVNRDVAPYEIVGGVPARRIGMRKQAPAA
ncbi:acyltransferase [Thermomonas sp.]|uniref:acyltransferase n=1 Tax=Thermomonas sp. TaxID=1971895 RepID=UPI002603CE87|nr:acyltransferase [Thermomonas sp.]MCO5054644.1 acyltransferase [Thermomonas sp.]